MKITFSLLREMGVRGVLVYYHFGSTCTRFQVAEQCPSLGYTMVISRATASVAFILLLIATLSSNAQSAEIKVGVDKSGQATIWITGQIVPGDADGFSQSVHQANDAGKFVANVRLDSPGSNLLEGVSRRYEVWQDIHRSSISSAIASRHGVFLLRDVQTADNKPRRRHASRNQMTQQIELNSPKNFLYVAGTAIALLGPTSVELTTFLRCTTAIEGNRSA